MDSGLIFLGIFIFLSFLYLDRVLAAWKKEHDQKLSEIKNAIDSLGKDLEK